MNIGNIFQQKIVSQTNPFGSPKSALNQALEQINNNILQNINLEASEKLKFDIYIPGTDPEKAAELEKYSNDELEYFSMHFTISSPDASPDIDKFREQLKGIDQTIQDYEKMLNGEMEMPTKIFSNNSILLNSQEKMTKEDVQFLLAKTKAFREEFIKDGVKQLNSLTNMASGLVSKGGARERIIQRILGESPLENIANSDWTIDLAAPDIYSELDKAQNATTKTFDAIKECERLLTKEMKKRGLGLFYESPEPEVTEKVPDTAKTYESMYLFNIQRLNANFFTD